MELKNTILISTDDKEFYEKLNEFAHNYCLNNDANIAVYKLDYKFGKKVKEKMFEWKEVVWFGLGVRDCGISIHFNCSTLRLYSRI